jgi:hypothetical protein
MFTEPFYQPSAFAIRCRCQAGRPSSSYSVLEIRVYSVRPYRGSRARSMLDAYQERLIALLQANTLPESDWFELVKLLKLAKVAIRPEMAEALALSAAHATPDEAAGAMPQDLSRQLRGLLDELGTSAEDPFMVVEGLAETGALMPTDLRAFMTHELGLSPHPLAASAGRSAGEAITLLTSRTSAVDTVFSAVHGARGGPAGCSASCWPSVLPRNGCCSRNGRC